MTWFLRVGVTGLETAT